MKLEFEIRNSETIEYIQENSINIEDFLKVYTEIDRYINIKKDIESLDSEPVSVLNSIKELIRSNSNSVYDQIQDQDQSQIILEELIEEFPESDCTQDQESDKGYFWIVKDDCPTIMIDIKNYSRNVPKNELDKFIF